MSKKPEQDRAVQRAIGALREEIRESLSGRLPPRSELASRLHTSLRTVDSAMKALEREGLLDIVNGKGTFVRKHHAHAPSCDTSARALARTIRLAIEQGTYAPGSPLPKVEYFVLTNSCARNTVTQALRLLARQGYAHKKRNRWYSGRAHRPSRRGTNHPARAAHRPVVLIVVESYPAWRELFSSHNYPFMLSFCAELTAHGIHYDIVQKGGASSSAHAFPTGFREIAAHIRKLDARLRGILIVRFTKSADIGSLQEWITWLGRFGKKLVWHDWEDNTPSRMQLDLPRKNFYRCAPDERALVRAALEQLVANGHQHIGIMRCGRLEGQNWYVRRMQVLEEAVRESFPVLRIHHVRQDENIWHQGDMYYRNPLEQEDLMLAHADAVAADLGGALRSAPGKTARRRFREEMARRMPSLTALLSSPDITAVIAPNQWHAVNYYHWCVLMGLRVPRDISILSFDNWLPFSRHPLSTIDQKLDSLGFRAAHLFIEDIPVKADARGNVHCDPVCIDRGSIGPPRPAGPALTNFSSAR
ncbi:MAG: GntR family transcriptional regulator [Chitinivibrionales bacterium]|nr:GntR family transcriptional regulator [Chitinivibrionales bacterium]MBD3394097.1 GntR family transcriptional regulator [Chitinivibrionales bacterium]